MKKTFAMDNLDCANCAAKMEKAILKIDGVKSATVSFLRRRPSGSGCWTTGTWCSGSIRQ